MIHGTHKFIAIALESPEEEALWTAIFASQGLTAVVIAPARGDTAAFAADPRLGDCMALVADAPALLSQGIAPGPFAVAARARFSGLRVFIRLPARVGISAQEQAWARGAGIASLLPGSTVAAPRESVVPVLARILENLDVGRVDEARLKLCLDSLVSRGVEPRMGRVKDIHVDAYHFESGGVNVSRIFERMQQGGAVEVADRAYRGKEYRECFIASEAIDWIEATYAVNRALATRIGSFLWRTGRFHHVVRDAAFADGFLFFRFGGQRADLDRVDLARVAQDIRAGRGPAISNRAYLGKVHARCFVGSEAVEWLCRTCLLTRGAAETIGQRLLDLGVLHHVLDEHGFIGGNYFYRFRADEAALEPA